MRGNKRRRKKNRSFIRSLTFVLVLIALWAGIFGELPEEVTDFSPSESSAVSGLPAADSTSSAQDVTSSYQSSSAVTEPASPAPSSSTITGSTSSSGSAFDISQIPAYSGKPSVDVNGDVPYFTEDELRAEPFESYSELDELGRCGVAYACVGPETMPTEKRGRIGRIKPTGWHTVKYAGIDGNYLYNRCHLIGYQLTGENANEKNLITGTRYMNVQGMLEFENSVAMYVKTTGYHVLYRVTPVFEGDNLLASGVLMEAKSVEDQEIQYCAFCYNVQPGITIDYATGDSSGPEYTGS